jgi:hypothetical protein
VATITSIEQPATMLVLAQAGKQVADHCLLAYGGTTIGRLLNQKSNRFFSCSYLPPSIQ